MSRNLEVLEQVQQDRELFRVAPVANRGPVYSKRTTVNGPDFGTDAVGREQLLALAQRLFLAADGKADSGPRQVVFCGIDEAEGTSVLCAQLGRLLASQVASQVCIVDANVRAPSLRRLLDVERSDGQSSQQASPQIGRAHV